jgi:hypothetical protein
MSAEILSTARPSTLRLAGFFATATGAALAGLGALVDWITVGFPGDVEGVADVHVRGTDVWEGKLVLAVAVGCLIALIIMRVTASPSARSAIAGGIAAGGVIVIALAAVDLSGATGRFGGSAGLADIAQAVADRLGQPVDRVRALLEQNFGATLRVDTEIGLWLSLLGGLLLVAAGGLSLALARRVEDASRPGPRPGPG